MVHNVNFLLVSQNSDLSLKLNSTRQQDSRGMLGFQNRAPNFKMLKFHVNQDNSAYLEKYDFQWKLVYQLWDHHWIHGIEIISKMVSDSDFESFLALHIKRDKL